VAELEGHVSRSAVYLIHKFDRFGAGAQAVPLRMNLPGVFR
jgi:hypothetical protein